jgi:hypothetical protein
MFDSRGWKRAVPSTVTDGFPILPCAAVHEDGTPISMPKGLACAASRACPMADTGTSSAASPTAARERMGLLANGIIGVRL